ncbi:MAG: hypothetical protein IT267_08445 [Saprospiraceae bacterium]|nr:hypothetical protein [Saprospiraceae bacterium]
MNFVLGQDQDQLDWKIYKSENYSIRYPKDWEFNKSGSSGIQFLLMSPLENEQDKLHENVSLNIQNGNSTLTLEQYAGLSRSQVIAQLKDGSILADEKKNQNGDEYYKLIYAGKMGDLHLAYMQHVRIKDSKVYLLTFTCEFSKIAQWQKTGEEILSTFQWL